MDLEAEVPPAADQVEAMSASTFEAFTKSTFVAGWVARGSIPANTGSRR